MTLDEQQRINAVRINEVVLLLDRGLKVLGEVNLKNLGGMSRAELADYRRQVKDSREHITLARQYLRELEAARRARTAATGE